MQRMSEEKKKASEYSNIWPSHWGECFKINKHSKLMVRNCGNLYQQNGDHGGLIL